MDIFSILGNNFFKALTGKYQNIFIDCLEIIYGSYRTELSYGIDKDILISQLCDYFEKNSSDDIQFEDDEMMSLKTVADVLATIESKIK